MCFLRWLCFLAPVLVNALKVPRSGADSPVSPVSPVPDVASVRREILEGDRRGANEALLAAAGRGKPHLALVLALAAQGFDPEILQQWLSASVPEPPPEDVNPVTEPAAADFQTLLSAIRHNDPSTARSVVVAIARKGGQHQVKGSLRGLQVLGYGPADLQSWLEHPEHPRSLAHQTSPSVESTWNVFLLMAALKRGKAEVKEVLSHAKAGGMSEVKDMLSRFASLGYNYNSLLHWLQSDARLPLPAETPKGTSPDVPDDPDFLLLRQSLDARNRSSVRDAIARMWKQGGQPHLSQVFAKLQTMGYDLDAIKSYYQAGKAEAQAQAQAEAEAPRSEKDAQELQGILRGADRALAKKAIRAMFESGGQSRVEAALGQLQALGYSPQALQAWMAGGKPVPAPGTPATPAAPGAKASITKNDSVVLAIGPVDQELNENKTASQKHSRGNPTGTSANLTGHGEHEVAHMDAEALAESFQHANRSAALRYMVGMFGSGGQDRVQRALETLQNRGYDAERFQLWMTSASAASGDEPDERAHANSEHSVTAATSTRPMLEPKADLPARVKTSANGSVSTASAQDLQEPRPRKDSSLSLGVLRGVLRGVQQGDKVEVVKRLAAILHEGGKSRIQEVFAKLQGEGYDSTELQAWLAGGRAPPRTSTAHVDS